jgi:hypothetical protein
MAIPVRLMHEAAIRLAVVRRRAALAELAAIVPQSCGLVWDFVQARNLNAGRNVAVYLNRHIDLEVGVELAGDFDEDGEVVRSITRPAWWRRPSISDPIKDSASPMTRFAFGARRTDIT